jgi:hypothetical protein
MRTYSSALAAALTLVLPAHTQTSRGAVAGAVTDHSGAMTAGANITLTDAQTGVRRSSLSNDAGIYRFEAVDLGGLNCKLPVLVLRCLQPQALAWRRTALRPSMCVWKWVPSSRS